MAVPMWTAVESLNSIAMVTGTIPFRTSRIRTVIPMGFPSVLRTFVAPIFPLPCSRISIPFIFPARNPKGVAPNTKARSTGQKWERMSTIGGIRELKGRVGEWSGSVQRGIAKVSPFLESRSRGGSFYLFEYKGGGSSGSAFMLLHCFPPSRREGRSLPWVQE